MLLVTTTDNVNEKYTMAKMMMYSFLVPLILLLNSCQPATSPMKIKKFEWNATVCAPKRFPIQLMQADLALEGDGQINLMPSAIISNGWGQFGSIELVGDDSKAMPTSLSVKWFSYVERKAYQGTFQLDSAKMQALFEDPSITPADNAKKPYEDLVVGLAPQGAVSIWLSGQGITKEVAHYTATETTVGGRDFLGSYPDIESYATDIVAGSFSPDQVEMKQVSAYDLGKWAKQYRQSYSWHWSVISRATHCDVLVQYFNGEAKYWPEQPDSLAIMHSPLPSVVTIRWKTNTGAEHATEIQLNEEEIFAAFNQLAQANEAMGLQLELNTQNGGTQMFVTNAQSVIALAKAKIKQNY